MVVSLAWGTTAGAITNGALDPGDPAVVALDGCTGTLISQRVVLTAAHCIWQREVVDLHAFFGASLAEGGRTVAIADGRVHPRFELATDDNDIGVLQLAEPVTDVTLPLMMAQPFDDSLVGAVQRSVGFGETAPADLVSYGVKRQGTSTVRAFLGETYTDDSIPSAACQGDSGGPSFLVVDGHEQLAGVISRGDGACTTFGVKVRVDAYAADFILPFVKATEPGGTPVGGRCGTDEQCAGGGMCVAAKDVPNLHYCSMRCTRDGDCGAGMRCSGGECRWPAPTPGALGSSCDQNADCLGWLCASGDVGAPRVCTIECIPGAASGCPGDYRCVPSRDDGGRDVCVPPLAGGCSITPHQVPGWPAATWPALVAAAALILRRLRFLGRI